jgi:predicted O-methyltransferase YrrM
MAPPNFALLDPHLNSLLAKLHNESDSQERIVRAFFILRVFLNKFGLSSVLSGDYFDWFMRDKSVALDRDKAQMCYLMIRAMGAKTVVEVGTSFGVSTIWLAAGVRDNSEDGEPGVVIATERETEKIAKAKANWEQAGLTKWIKLLDGNVLETLRDVHLDDPVDLVLMDIWTPLALLSLKNLIPKMRKGSYLMLPS